MLAHTGCCEEIKEKKNVSLGFKTINFTQKLFSRILVKLIYNHQQKNSARHSTSVQHVEGSSRTISKNTKKEQKKVMPIAFHNAMG